MTERRLVLGLAAAALFGAGFGLGWLVRGERAAPADLSSAAAPGEGTADASSGEAGAAGDGGTASTVTASAGTTGTASGGAGADGPGGEGSVAVVGSSGASSGGAGSTGAAGEAAGEASGATAPTDGGVRGRLDATAIRDVVRDHRDELGFCFAWQLHSHPDLNGRVTMEFEIGPDGHVTEARVADDALGDETVTRCFTGVTRRMEFPEPEGGGTVTVRYPFILSPEPAPDEP
ncbi:MAG: energy transducer TonB [Sandaracinaceae bacterium]|nr:energy transducer TonB [Sandaracinaceae bacterium]